MEKLKIKDMPIFKLTPKEKAAIEEQRRQNIIKWVSEHKDELKNTVVLLDSLLDSEDLPE